MMHLLHARWVAGKAHIVVPGLRQGVLLALCLLAGRPALVRAQAPADVASELTRYQQTAVPEKLFLHIDRPLYLSGETMWFKAYASDGATGLPLALSSVAYVEVLNVRNQPVLQGKVALKEAAGRGSFLLPASLPSGRYTVRAYTRWMQNFAPETYFHSTVTVVNTTTALSAAPAKDSAAVDAQFFPEGGRLVQGLRSKVGFKVTDRGGRGRAATGQVRNQRGEVVATFRTLQQGMGSFELTPASARDTYTAVVQPAGLPPLMRKLPAADEWGYVVRLEDSSPEQLTLTVSSPAGQPEILSLLTHGRRQAAAVGQATLANGQAVFTIRKALLPDGVAHLTVFNAARKPVAERLYFTPPRQPLALEARADKPQYTTREKVTVQLGATSQPASLSMAVYRLDSLNASPASTIDQYLALTADLKGTVENPGYYFTATGAEAAAAADNLMLTQGWSRFRWAEVLSPTAPALPFLPEPNGLVVRARLTQAGSGQPKPGIVTYLTAPGPTTTLSNTRSDANGLVQFEMPKILGPRELVMLTDPRQDSTSRLALISPYSTHYATALQPAFALVPRFQQDYAKRHLQAQLQQAYAGPNRHRYLLPPTDTLSFFGPPSETYYLDRYTRFKVMEEVLREYVPGVVVRIRKDGFHFMVVDEVNKTVLTENPMVLLDGVPVFNLNRIMKMDPLKIRKLEVVDSRYFHGAAIYDGVVSFSTYKGDLEGFQLDPQVLVQQYEGLQVQREFYAPRYDTPEAAQSRLPDLRNLLYWNPDITTSATASKPLSFYTGDQAGRYLVVLQGLGANGQAGSRRFVLEVKPAL
ncbi:hypothetical protein MON38_14150 [Hymenobacter sp. DH14]|uniref:Macroglobulin domain-containing protein n=1 Tax=Hymenobacter cyanobacteriorum TaxID=2926463 RepID=A0A9X1VI35_9BACT|nr:hypothetical protein [Hymenobacter cyanobacteriorum]MCI1188568.1 hypothetical protein [Hymenobacter cyanobacteriorum]